MSMPYPHEVAFDHGKADAAIAGLQDTIRMLRHQTGLRASRAQDLRKDWEGGHADTFFGTDLRRMQRRADELVRALHRELVEIEHAKERAHRLQRQHDAANRRYAESHPNVPAGPYP